MNDMSVQVRERTIGWDDPRTGAKAGLGMAGIDFLRAVAEGRLPRPPISAFLDFQIVEVEHGRAVFSCRPQEIHCNPMGTVHGGLSATLIDSAAGCAIHSTLGAGKVFGTVDLTTTLVRPILPGGPQLFCAGQVLHQGRSIATAEARVVDETGTLYAYGHVTAKITVLSKD